MNGWYLAAAGFSLLTALTHIFVGGHYVVRPLLACEGLPRVSRFTNYYTWHVVTILLISMAVLFAYAGLYPTEIILPLSQTALAGAFMVLSFVLLTAKGMRPLHMPQWLLFLPVTLCGLCGLLS